MENSKDRRTNLIDITGIIKELYSKKLLFLKVWITVFILSCVWILPQPRYYTCGVSMAPESSENSTGGGLASLAYSFGVNLGGTEGSDAIYPELYPDLFESNEFMVDLLDITVTTKDNKLTTDYYDYLRYHQKQNVLLFPLTWIKNKLKQFTQKKEEIPMEAPNGKRFNHFYLTREVNNIVMIAQGKIKCNYSKTTGVISIEVTDQDPLVCALLADSIKSRLQDFITEYRTKKARNDYEHYLKLTEEAKREYEIAKEEYVRIADANINAFLTKTKTKQGDANKKMDRKYEMYTALNTRLEASLAKVQERTPVFTTLKSASVPVKPAGPKRMIFVFAMLVLSTFATIAWQYKKELIEWF